jgi:O-acetyl-ADP-ribose deacetylase (regulator of RNase III)
MTIQIVKGDAVKALKNKEINYLLHCVNCQGVMGSGIALQIKNTFPEVYEDYTWFVKNNYDPEVCKPTEPLLGNYRLSFLKDLSIIPPKTLYNRGVVNLFGQENFGMQVRQLNYGAISNALYKFYKEILEDGNMEEYKFAFPMKMGCDRAGGNWEVVYEIIEFYLSSCDVRIYQL